MKATKRWRIIPQDRTAVGELARALDVPRAIAHVMRSRGVVSAEAGRAFLNPRTEALSDPFRMTDMDRAVERLQRARDAAEHVCVFGDYDVDGMSGTALLKRGLTRYGVHTCTCAIPSRLKDGYGLAPIHVERAKEAGVNVIVTVDNGIKSHAAAERAAALGVDLIITDHHAIDEDFPDAIAVINPHRNDSTEAFSDLSGAAVALKLSMALNGDNPGCERAALEYGLAALGLVADIVPLRKENRSLVARGLAMLSQCPPPGIAALAKRAGLNLGELRAESIAFQLGPRLNASGRVGNGQSSLELLLTVCPREAARLAEELHAANEERRRLERQICDEAELWMLEHFDPDQRSIVLTGHTWHPGVIGIVASKLQSHYARPVVLIAVSVEGIGRASARSSADFDIMRGMRACAHLLEKFGGHEAAAGMTIRADRIGEFTRIFEETVRLHLPPGERTVDVAIDAQISLTEIDGRLIRALDQLEPFGAANAAPVFCAFGAELVPHSFQELKGGHLRAAVRDGRAQFACIGFGMGGRLRELSAAGRVDLAFTPKFNTWRGETSIQLELKDIRAAETAASP